MSPPTEPTWVDQHIRTMTIACTNLLRQMASEGLCYRLMILPEDTGTLHVTVRDLTSQTEARIRRCLVGTAMHVQIREDQP